MFYVRGGVTFIRGQSRPTYTSLAEVKMQKRFLRRDLTAIAVAVSFTVLAVMAIAQRGKAPARRPAPAVPPAVLPAATTAGLREGRPCQEQPVQAPPARADKLPEGVLPGGRDATGAVSLTTSPSEGDEAAVARTNYLSFTGVRWVLVTDSQGHSRGLLDRPAGEDVEGIDTAREGEDSVLVMASADKTYVITFQPRGGAVALDLLRGQDRTSPEVAVRYNDLLLPSVATGMLKITPEGIEPLRADADNDGTFEAEIKPDAYVTGPAAADTQGPTICFDQSRRGTATMVSLSAADLSGVKDIYYSLDAEGPGGMTVRRYAGPIEVDPSRTPVVHAFADDMAGNRSVMYGFRLGSN
jgi:hypothetical protein